MDKYNNLLLKVAGRYNIIKGTEESENDWKARLIYSICGMIGYASLWDESEEETVSIVHLKSKVRSILNSYKSMYSELSQYLPNTAEELEEEIVGLFLKTGVVYQRPYQIASAMKHEEAFGNILFQRGIALDNIACVSGIGFYAKKSEEIISDGIKSMFGLEQEKLLDLWSSTVAAASWKTDLSLEHNIKYLRLKPPFTRGYWVDKPERNGTISILRVELTGLQLYYLYRYAGTKLEVSPLPQWQVEEYNYRTLASACLLTYGTLPQIEYEEDGALVYLSMNYLLPPRELNFLKLYSWPQTCTNIPSNFKRKLSKDVFIAIKSILLDAGYKFKEVKTDAPWS